MELNLTFSSSELTVAMGGLNVMATYREVVNALTRLEQKMAAIDDALADLTTELAAMTTADQAIIALVQGFPTLMDAAIADAISKGVSPAQLAAIVSAKDTVKSQTSALVNAAKPATP